MEYEMRNWYYFNWLCGVDILVKRVHNIDGAKWFIREQPKAAS